MSWSIKIENATHQEAREIIDSQEFGLSDKRAALNARSHHQGLREILHKLIDTVPIGNCAISIQGGGHTDGAEQNGGTIQWQTAKKVVPEPAKEDSPDATPPVDAPVGDVGVDLLPPADPTASDPPEPEQPETISPEDPPIEDAEAE